MLNIRYKKKEEQIKKNILEPVRNKTILYIAHPEYNKL